MLCGNQCDNLDDDISWFFNNGSILENATLSTTLNSTRFAVLTQIGFLKSINSYVCIFEVYLALLIF